MMLFSEEEYWQIGNIKVVFILSFSKQEAGSVVFSVFYLVNCADKLSFRWHQLLDRMITWTGASRTDHDRTISQKQNLPDFVACRPAACSRHSLLFESDFELSIV
ncbi:hypothetical protein LP7551_02274 [Roseibium album]|nr:hypothetical protein LP7551_02274 [Roseibium album]